MPVSHSSDHATYLNLKFAVLFRRRDRHAGHSFASEERGDDSLRAVVVAIERDNGISSGVYEFGGGGVLQNVVFEVPSVAEDVFGNKNVFELLEFLRLILLHL